MSADLLDLTVATRVDVAAAYRCLLGREAETPAVVDAHAGRSMRDLLGGFIGSEEFADGVAAPLLSRGTANPDRFLIPPGPDDLVWAATRLPVTAPTAEALRQADGWPEVLRLALGDRVFGELVEELSPSWRREDLTAAMWGWTAKALDEGRRDEDWGESIAERAASMRRDAAERLRPARRPGTARPGLLITVITPVFQSPLDHLVAAIDSVRGQTYPSWELILVDDGSTKAGVRSVLEAYAALDGRIRAILQPENRGIAAASNAGLAAAKGEFLALLDHDDLLTHDALEHIAAAAAPEVDWIYSDECLIDVQDRVEELFPKPDWSPTLLLNMMYTGHLSAYRTARVRELGGFRSEYDFSQDYDLALRMAEQSPCVVHLDRILYGWRRVEGSAAAGGKDFARRSNIAALQDALDRRGLDGFAEALPTANRARRRPSPPPRVAVVIPSDDEENIRASVRSILQHTWYEAYEVRVVTNSPLAARLAGELADARVRWVPYDRTFNFSDKCNVGAADADADFVVFFNDDVRVITPDWLSSLLEAATLPGVGAVGAKLLYEDDALQHAGMVTGVRRLVGTAFHGLPADSHALFNIGAQSVREVSLLCGALLLMPLPLFRDMGGFDAVNTPVGHSDVDLCLRVRERSLLLLYTPYAVLRHIGHASIGQVEAAEERAPRPRRRDKADIHLLRRFPEALAYDPFFPGAVRGLFHRDSEASFQLHPPTRRAPPPAPGGRDVLIISNELTGSGAPKLVLDMTRTLIAQGHDVVVASRRNGSMRPLVQEAGAPVIVDARLFDADEWVRDFGRNFDLVIANTAVSWMAVRQLAPLTDVRWYFHEVDLVTRLAREQPLFAPTLGLARELWAGSRLSREVLADLGADSRIVSYGVDDAGMQPPTHNPRVRVGVFATYEKRKGQDLALQAWRHLPPELQRAGELLFHGRVLEKAHHAQLVAAGEGVEGVRIEGELDHAGYLEALRGCDVVLIPSRDDTLPLVSLDALSAGRVVACSRRVGTAAYLQPGVSGLVCEDPTPEELAALMAQAIADGELRATLGRGARALFEREFTHAAFDRRLREAVEG